MSSCCQESMAVKIDVVTGYKPIVKHKLTKSMAGACSVAVNAAKEKDNDLLSNESYV